MNTIYSPVDTLNDQRVKSYFLGILGSNLTVDEKYQRFVDFFAKELVVRDKLLESLRGKLEEGGEARELEEELARVSEKVSEAVGAWRPEYISRRMQDAIRRAVRRLRTSQHQDKGWGPTPENSQHWGTAYAVLCLNAARTLHDVEFDVDIDDMLKGGISWLATHPEKWSVDYIGSLGQKSVTDVAVAIVCLLRTPREYTNRVAGATSRGVERLARAQNVDGGWDAQLWGENVGTLRGVWSYVPSTSFALQALSGTGDMKFEGNASKALAWLIRTQNEEGSWNFGSCQPGASMLSGPPTFVRTCEALQGIIAATVLKVSVEGMERSIAKAVEWIRTQEKPIFDSDRNIKGWGWESSTSHCEDTCFTVETLAQLPQASPPLLSANAKWLVDTQVKRDNDPEDGNWPQGHTARLALSLIEFYKRVRADVQSNGQTR
jgi:squalene cyclase